MIVLDTHAWLWWSTAPTKLSRLARRAVDSSPEIGVPAVSCWEIGVLAERGRIALDRELSLWVDSSLAGDDRIVCLPLTSDVAVRAALLAREGFHGDPADRMIYATARANGARLVTRDERIRSFDPAGTIW